MISGGCQTHMDPEFHQYVWIQKSNLDFLGIPKVIYIKNVHGFRRHTGAGR